MRQRTPSERRRMPSTTEASCSDWRACPLGPTSSPSSSTTSFPFFLWDHQVRKQCATHASSTQLHNQQDICKYFNNALYWRSFFVSTDRDSKHGASEFSGRNWSGWRLVTCYASTCYFFINDNRSTTFSLSTLHRWSFIYKWMITHYEGKQGKNGWGFCISSHLT